MLQELQACTKFVENFDGTVACLAMFSQDSRKKISIAGDREIMRKLIHCLRRVITESRGAGAGMKKGGVPFRVGNANPGGS